MASYCCAPPAEDLELIVDGDDLRKRLRSKHGYDIPCVACPSIDFTGKNQLTSLYIAEYEHGLELTMLFLDEDRPNMCTDRFYDCIRKPLFGRHSDIETVFIIDNDKKNEGDDKTACACVEFPGTYSADQTWETSMPQHNDATIELSKFVLQQQQQEKKKDGEDAAATTNEPSSATTTNTTTQPTIWVNTWNHLFGEKNNNTDLDITYMYPKFQQQQTAGSGADDADEGNNIKKKYFDVRKGSRSEVDARFTGIMTSVSKVMTDERKQKLGKRL